MTIAVVDTAGARVVGHELETVSLFAGVRFAAAPVGPLRFAPPEPSFPEGRYAAAEFGPAAPQVPRGRSVLLHGPLPKTDEDCLQLNIWVPRGADGPLPVLVWLHGGAFVSGHTGADCYHAARFADRGRLIVVTVAYRLGSLGWLAHPDLGDGPAGGAGNWGLLDQMLALDWVAENIAAFGGDPGCVTLAGQSAGASCAVLLASSALAGRRFHRVVAHSPLLAVASAEDAERWAAALTSAVTGTHDVSLLRSVESEAIVRADAHLMSRPEFRRLGAGPFPVLGGPGLSPALDDSQPAAAAHVPVLLGSTRDEGRFFFRDLELDDTALLARLRRLLPDADHEYLCQAYRSALAASGRAPEASAVFQAIWADTHFQGPLLEWARGHDAGGAAGAYTYLFCHESPDRSLGAGHTVDVPLLFGSHRRGRLGELCGAGEDVDALSDQMIDAWSAFAATGRPVSAQLPSWPRLDPVVISSNEPWRVQSHPDEGLRALKTSLEDAAALAELGGGQP